MNFIEDSNNNRYDHKTNTVIIGGWVGNKMAWILPGGSITMQVGTAKRALFAMAKLKAANGGSLYQGYKTPPAYNNKI